MTKKHLSIILAMGISALLHAQTVVSTAGNLEKQVTAQSLTTATKLIVSGTIDASDFLYLRGSSFDTIDLHLATIQTYTGTKGTKGSLYTGVVTYEANTIPESAFEYSQTLKSITLPNVITAIGDRAFYDCMNLNPFTLPTSLKSIGTNAFFQCWGFVGSLIIPQGVTTIQEGAFSNCRNLNGILTIPNTVTSIGKCAFFNNTLTGNLSLKSVTFLGDSAFSTSKGITSVELGSSLTRIPYFAFSDCSNLKSVTLSSSLDTIDAYAFDGSSIDTISIPASVTYIGYCAFAGTKIRSITIPSSVKKLEGQAFDNCNALQAITLPQSFSHLGSILFNGCTSLKSITVLDSKPLLSPIVENGVFYNCNTTCILFVPKGSGKAYKNAAPWNSLSIVEGMADLYVPASILDSVVMPKTNSFKIPIKAKTAWQASSSDAWISLSPTKGTGNDTIIVTASTTKSVGYRKATVQITSAGLPTISIAFLQDLSVISPATSPSLTISTTNIMLEAKASQDSIHVKGNVRFTASKTQSWLTLTKIAGSGDTIILVKALQNTLNQKRTDTIIIVSSGLANKTIVVTQAAAVASTESDIVEPEGTLYPNPANNVLYSSIPNQTVLSIYNEYGTCVLIKTSDLHEAIAIEALPRGLYFVKIQTSNDKTIVKSFVKE